MGKERKSSLGPQLPVPTAQLGGLPLSVWGRELAEVKTGRSLSTRCPGKEVRGQNNSEDLSLEKSHVEPIYGKHSYFQHWLHIRRRLDRQEFFSNKEENSGKVLGKMVVK